MSCPFFLPTERLEDGNWLHSTRLPLGGGWLGQCCAPGYEGVQPATHELREFCNLGYARRCSRLPQERTVDALRFAVIRDIGTQLLLQVVCEYDHRPAGHGTLEFDVALNQWVTKHSDPRIQRMAECYLEAYLSRRSRVASQNRITRTDA